MKTSEILLKSYAGVAHSNHHGPPTTQTDAMSVLLKNLSSESVPEHTLAQNAFWYHDAYGVLLKYANDAGFTSVTEFSSNADEGTFHQVWCASLFEALSTEQ